MDLISLDDILSLISNSGLAVFLVVFYNLKVSKLLEKYTTEITKLNYMINNIVEAIRTLNIRKEDNNELNK